LSELDIESRDKAENIRTLARLLDSAFRIPGTGVRVGADSIFGLIPVIGDFAGAALSGYIVLASARLGVPPAALVRMLINIGIDTVVGSVPVLGDMFDAGWRANIRNVALLDSHLGGDVQAKRANRMVLIAVIIGLILLAAGSIFLGILAIRFLARLASS
jgi:hypothetical protein